MFFIDKYTITSKYRINFSHHREIYKKLFGDLLPAANPEKQNFAYLPNLLVHGGTGCGKKTLINIILKELYGENALKTRKEEYSISGYGNTNVDVEIEQSDFHLVIEPNNSGFDKYLIQEIVTEYAKRQSQFVSSKAPFKIVVINNVDHLSYYAQTSLRCTMERYQKNCKFILCSYQISKIIDPLRSRCLDVRVPKPSLSDIMGTLLWIAECEGFNIPPKVSAKILKECNKDVKAAIWMLDMYRQRICNFSLAWKTTLDRIVTMMHHFYFKKKPITIANITECRLILNNILITNISGTEIMVQLLEKIIHSSKQFPNNFLHKIVEKFSEFDNRLSKGKRSIIHLEGLLIGLFYLSIQHEN
jgi:replication factor C subunit 3/5